MKTTCSENDYRTRIADAARRATTTELRYHIRLKESAASPEARYEAKCQMYQAERDLVCAISGDPGAAPQNLKRQ